MDEMITVLIVPVNEAPYLEKIPNTLEAMQEIVGGYIEVVRAGNGINLVINEEGKLLDLEPNIWIYGGKDYLCGQFFVCLNDGFGEFNSIPRSVAELFILTNVMCNKVDPNKYSKINWELSI